MGTYDASGIELLKHLVENSASHGPIVVPRTYLGANPLGEPPLRNNWPEAIILHPTEMNPRWPGDGALQMSHKSTIWVRLC